MSLLIDLDYPTLLSLSTVSRGLHLAVDPNALCCPSLRRDFYLCAERSFPQHANHLVCFVCWRFLTPDRFGDSQRRGKRGKFSTRDGVMDGKGGRFCFECGVERRRYGHLEGVLRGGVRWYPCWRCERAGRGQRRCVLVLGKGCEEGECGEHDEDGRGEGYLEEEVERKEGLERLAEGEGVLKRVCGELGYGDLMRLREVNRFLSDFVKPVRMCRDVYGMWELVLERTKVVQREWDRAMEPCFGCFRPRTWKQFPRTQYYLSGTRKKGQEYWRRRCWECLRRFYHPHLADAEARDRFQRQTLCRECKCLRYSDEPCRGCVVHAEKVAEWVRLRKLKGRPRKQQELWGDEEDVLVRWFAEDVFVETGDEEPEHDEREDDAVWDGEVRTWLYGTGLNDEGSSSASMAVVISSQPVDVVVLAH